MNNGRKKFTHFFSTEQNIEESTEKISTFYFMVHAVVVELDTMYDISAYPYVHAESTPKAQQANQHMRLNFFRL